LKNNMETKYFLDIVSIIRLLGMTM
jgi:hypothetical protein